MHNINLSIICGITYNKFNNNSNDINAEFKSNLLYLTI